MNTEALMRPVRERARRWPGWVRRAWVTDVVVVVLFAIFAAVGTRESVEEGNGLRALDALAWAMIAVSTVALVFRRRRPEAALAATYGSAAVYFGLGYAGGPIGLAPLIALYSAASVGRRAAALVAAVAFVVAPLTWAALADGVGGIGEVGVWVLFVALTLATGEVARGRRAYLAEAERRAAEAERTREETARRRANEERLRVARDLHDVTAHTIAVIAIQANVAGEALGGEQASLERARQAVQAIREASREAMSELKATVTMLREGEAPRTPLPGLSQVDDLAGMATSAGVRVAVDVDGTARPLPPAVDLTAYRVVQESLTNVLRHARATSATVRVRYGADAVEVEVDDDGRGAAAPTGDGHGLATMAERAAAVGGRLTAGPRPAGGFRVHARLPLREARP